MNTKIIKSILESILSRSDEELLNLPTNKKWEDTFKTLNKMHEICRHNEKLVDKLRLKYIHINKCE